MKSRSVLLPVIILLVCFIFILLAKYKRRAKSAAGFTNSIAVSQEKEITALDTIADIDSVKKKPVIANDTNVARVGSIRAAKSADQRGNLLFNFTAEAPASLTSLSQYSLTSWNSLGRCCDYSIQRSSDYARSGKYSIRYELNSTDADVAGSKRAETSRYSLDEPNGNIERWYGASYYLPDDYEIDPAPELLTQWQSLKGINPPLSLWTLDGKWFIVQHIDQGETRTFAGDYKKNVWTDFVFHVKWSTGSDGLIDVWKDGQKVFTKEGANTYIGIAPGNYMKTGIYKWPWKKTDSYHSTTSRRIVYIDDVRIGNESATYNDVKPSSD